MCHITALYSIEVEGRGVKFLTKGGWVSVFYFRPEKFSRTSGNLS